MKAAVLYDPFDLRVIDTPRPEAGPEGVLVEVKAAGICGSDLHTYKTGIFKEMGIPTQGGIAFGHEFGGVVVEIGDQADVQGIKVGDRVVGIDMGAYAEYVRVGPELLGAPKVVKIPDAVSFEEAATLEPLAVSVSAVRRGQPQQDDTVLILGGGMIGLGCVQVLKASYTVKQIVVSDISEKRLAPAQELGADIVINAREQDVVEAMRELTGSAAVSFNPKPTAHVDVVIECAGLELTAGQALEVVTPTTGRVVFVALYEHIPKINLNDVVTKNHALYGVFAYDDEEFAESVRLVSSGEVDRKPLITHRFPLEQAKQAFETQINTKESLKVVLVP